MPVSFLLSFSCDAAPLGITINNKENKTSDATLGRSIPVYLSMILSKPQESCLDNEGMSQSLPLVSSFRRSKKFACDLLVQPDIRTVYPASDFSYQIGHGCRSLVASGCGQHEGDRFEWW